MSNIESNALVNSIPNAAFVQPAKFVAKLRRGQTELAEARAKAAGGNPASPENSSEVLVGGQRMLLLKVMRVHKWMWAGVGEGLHMLLLCMRTCGSRWVWGKG